MFECIIQLKKRKFNSIFQTFCFPRFSGTGSSSSFPSGCLMVSSSSCWLLRWPDAANQATTHGMALQTCVWGRGTWRPCCSNWASAWLCVPSWRNWPTWSCHLCVSHFGPCCWEPWWSWASISFLKEERPEGSKRDKTTVWPWLCERIGCDLIERGLRCNNHESWTVKNQSNRSHVSLT